MECFEIRDLTFSYPDAVSPALEGVSLTVRAGEFVTVAGPSGCGKSTLLRHLKTPLMPYGARAGKVLFEGTPLEDIGLREQTAQIGFVMQDPESQIVTDKVWHELAFGLESLGYDTLTIRRRVAEMASYFGIGPWFHRDVRELSGGQKQLLNLAAIMAMQPSVLILDEPTAQLDPIAATDFLETVFRINRDMGTTVLMTEHRLEEVLPMSDRVVIMDAGRIVCYGTPSETGRLLWKQGHAMFLSMPTAMRVSAAASCSDVWPVTVREGRAWLADYRDTHGFHAVPPEPSRPAPAGTPALELDEIWFRYEKEAPDVLRGLSLRVYPGEFLAVMGGNGAGKSTTLSIAAGLRRPYRGHVRINGAELAAAKNPYRGLLGVLPQDPRTLFVKKSVREDLQDMLMKDSGTRLFEEVTSRCHVRELLDRHPYDLSGGERQRVALAKILLLEPKVLLLDEPTKGLDGAFKAEFADILSALLQEGVCIVMVSHDIEFCAKYAHRCAMVFDGIVTSEGTPRAFFGGNSFYTTAANRMSRALLPGAVTAEDVIAACTGAPPDGPRGEDDTSENRTREICTEAMDAPQKTGQSNNMIRRRNRFDLSKRTTAALLIVLLLIPATVYLGMRVFEDRKYTLISFLIIIEAMLPFALLFEGRRPQARELVVVAVLCAVGVAGRTAFAMLPGFKPVMAIVILSGVALGCETGFLIGAATMFVSNFFFGQGPWTPWQMFTMGLIGFLAGAFFAKRGAHLKKWILCVFGALAAALIYGGIMNPASVMMYQPDPSWEMIAAAYLTGVPVDIAHAAATVLFLWLFAKPFLEKIERVRTKYGLIE